LSTPTQRDAQAATTHEPLAVGIDSLYVSFYIDGIGIDWEKLRFEKERLRASPGQDFAEFELGGEQFALRRGAPKPYSFVLSNRAFTINLAERMQPRCYAQFHSELLWRERLVGALNRFYAMLANIGTREIRQEVVARVDAAFDFAVGSRDGVFVTRFKSDQDCDLTFSVPEITPPDLPSVVIEQRHILANQLYNLAVPILDNGRDRYDLVDFLYVTADDLSDSNIHSAGAEIDISVQCMAAAQPVTIAFQLFSVVYKTTRLSSDPLASPKSIPVSAAPSKSSMH